MRAIIGGDSFENALLTSKSQVQAEVIHGMEAVKWLTDKLLPIKKQILYVGSGNHDFVRSYKINGLPPSEVLAVLLDVPFFRSFGSVMFNVRKNLYTVFAQHSGKAPERVEWVQAAIHFHEHNHKLGTYRPITVEPNKVTKQWIARPTYHLQGGSYLLWANSYASDKMYRPFENGSVIAELSGEKENWKVTVFDDIDLFKRVVKV